ncbi:MAG: type I restriction-modification system subunit M, partial [Candidatus Methanoperedenaceae archaeon]|nr:type I restriction-modification system subunit M [Candidatus Methanoperedenaceae archaeon]
NLKGVIDVADFNDDDKLGKGKEMVDRLTNLVAIFENPGIDFSKNKAEGDDILGDAYEYLMRHFATESGKSKGQFYTPAEVSRILAKVIGINKARSQEQTIYDLTCGSGSLLIKAADESETGVTIYGQEMDNATAALAKMNMILHNNPTAEIWKDNTLSNPYFKNPDGTLKTFDFAVANPPFSNKAWSNGFDPANDLYDRFKGYGIPPKKNGDYAFLLHMIRSLKSKGKGAIILPHGVLFRGNAEAEIRKNIIRKGFIKGIIGLPANLFYGTGIPACIIVLDKENADSRRGIFLLDASRGFVKDGNKNRLREQDVHKIVDVFNKQTEVPKYARMVSVEEIERNEYNLNIPRYIDSQEAEDIQDIKAHLLGDIPNRDVEDLENYWKVYPSLKNVLFAESPRAEYSKLKIPQEEIKHVIFSHPEFTSYIKEIDVVFNSWKEKHTLTLKSLAVGAKPKEVIRNLSEAILTSFADRKLIDQYDVYQHLMTYWSDTMQDDAYLIAVDGWKAELTQRKKDEWDCDLVPKQLVIKRYFAAEQKAVEQLEADRDAISRQMEELEEEHGGEEGMLEEAKTDKGKVTKALIQKRVKEIKNDADASEEMKVLEGYLKLIEKEADANKKIKDAQTALDKKVIARYKALTEDEVKTLVVDDKWMAAISQDVKTELERISQRLTQRIKELAERYAAPMPELNTKVDGLETKVNKHLGKMGFAF